MRRFDPGSLRTRLALILAAAAALPMLVLVPLYAQEEENQALSEVLARQQVLVTALAQDVSDYIGLHQAAVNLLAGQPGLFASSAGDQHAVLENSHAAYPDMVGFDTVAADGTSIARADDQPATSWVGDPVFEEARRTHLPSSLIRISPTSHKPVLTLGVPVLDAGGVFTGMVSASLDFARASEFLTSTDAGADAKTYLVDASGRIIAPAGQDQAATFADLSDSPAVAAFRNDSSPIGSVRISGPGGPVLASYARVPDLGLGVIVERPAGSALAATHGKLDLLFGGLLLAVCAAAGFGVLAAGWLSRPLVALAAAVEGLARGDDNSPLPAGALTEIAGLAVAFATMRQRVTSRTTDLLIANRELEAVYRVGQTITAPLQLDIVLNTIARSTAELLRSDSGAILLVDWATQTLSVQGAYGLSERAIRDTRDRVGESIAGRVVQTGLPYIANDLPNDPFFSNPAAEDERLLAIASVPLIVSDRIIGTLDVHSRTNRFAFDDHHVQLLQMIASQAAIAIENGRLYQELLGARDELQRSNRELQDFASIASHDLQEPLRKVQAFGNRLSQKCYDQLGEEGRLYVDRMQNAASRMQTLVTDLLAFSRVTAQSLPFVEVDLNVLMSEVLADLEVAVEQASADVEVGPLPTIAADPTQMRQLFQNLLSNGLKFRHPDVRPRLRVASRALDVSGNQRPASDWYEISVSDNGIGFDEKYLDRIFTIFQRLHGRAEYEGTGVGLAVCRKIVERHGGTITARSTVHEGSTFLLTLPSTQTAAGALRAA